MSLLKQVINHATGQATSSQATLRLFVQCVEHMAGDSGDWTPLAALIGRSQPAQSARVRQLVAQSLNGWALKKDPEVKQTGGLRFVKREGHNQGFNWEFVDKVRAEMEGKAGIQSKSVKDLLPKRVSAEKSQPQYALAFRKYADKMAKDHGLTRAELLEALTVDAVELERRVLLAKANAL
jgi:hypothetical protein